MDFPIVYASGLRGVAGDEPNNLSTNLEPLFDEILNLPKYAVNESAPLQLLIANIDVDGFKGKMGIGRIMRGKLKANTDVVYGKPGQPLKRGKINEVCIFDNVGQVKVQSADAGEIAVVVGIPDIAIGDTIMSPEDPTPLPAIVVDEPTVRITIGVNKSPFSGREGKLLQSRVIRDRLIKELEKNVALRMSETLNSDTFEVCGRGQLHLTVLIEDMRREGFELMIGPPTVIDKVIDGITQEPFEIVDVVAPNEYSSSIVDMMNRFVFYSSCCCSVSCCCSYCSCCCSVSCCCSYCCSYCSCCCSGSYCCSYCSCCCCVSCCCSYCCSYCSCCSSHCCSSLQLRSITMLCMRKIRHIQ